MTGFTGFPPEGLNFLADLEQNNNKEWFDANRQLFKDSLQQPALRFIEDVGEQLKLKNPKIRYDLRTNGSGSLMRINRDTRFSKDKSPYKTNIAGMWWQGEGKKTEHPAFGFQLEPDGMKLMSGMFAFDKTQLSSYRSAVDGDDLGPKLQELIDRLEANAEYEVFGESYKRVPRGMDPNHERERLLRFSSLHVAPTQTITSRDMLTSTKLASQVAEHLLKTTEVQQWLVKALQ